MAATSPCDSDFLLARADAEAKLRATRDEITTARNDSLMAMSSSPELKRNHSLLAERILNIAHNDHPINRFAPSTRPSVTTAITTSPTAPTSSGRQPCFRN